MKRARDPAQKLARRVQILNAAVDCYLENPGQLPSAADVAHRSGVAKGTVYLYFKTKEEMFLAVFSDRLEQLLAGFESLTPERPLAEQIPQRLMSFFESEPVFLPLASKLHAILEQNLSADSLYKFKRQLCQLLATSGRNLDKKFAYPAGHSERALLHSYAAVTGLWQMLYWPAQLAKVRNDPDFAPLQRNFQTELTYLLQRFW